MGAPSAEARYLPLKVGATWTYRVTNPAAPGSAATVKTSRVEAHELVGDLKPAVSAFRVLTIKAGGGSTVSWQEVRGLRVVRHRERSLDGRGMLQLDEWYLPEKLRLDEAPGRLAAGATWTESYRETQMAPGVPNTTVMPTDQWTVEPQETITVPAGSFPCLKLRRRALGGTATADKTYWFARGVGKVKETGGQSEELVSYSIP